MYEVRLAAGNPSGYGDFTLWRQGNTSVIKCSGKSNADVASKQIQ